MLNRKSALGFSGGLCLLMALAGLNLFGGDRTETETLERSYNFPGNKTLLLEVDNIHGPISVESISGNQMKLVVHKTIVARNDRAMEEARELVNLEINQQETSLSLYVDAPYRHHQGKRHRRYGFHVKYDIKIQTPPNVTLDLKTVNDGTISIVGTNGDFWIHNVNGSIRMEGIEGSGEAVTVNGGITVGFQAPPQADLRLKTINGDLDVTFPSDMEADFKIKTFNGEIYTDFETTQGPVAAPKKRRKNGLTHIVIEDVTTLRVGSGGPVFDFDTLNGDILVRNGG